MRLALILLVTLIHAASIFAGSIKNDAKKIKYDMLKINPEKYKNDEITYEGLYYKYNSNIPKYMELSGIRDDKYLLLFIESTKVPVLVRKDNALSRAAPDTPRNGETQTSRGVLWNLMLWFLGDLSPKRLRNFSLWAEMQIGGRHACCKHADRASNCIASASDARIASLAPSSGR